MQLMERKNPVEEKKINTKKTKATALSKKQTPPSVNIIIHGTPIGQILNIVSLGLVYSKNDEREVEIRRK